MRLAALVLAPLLAAGSLAFAQTTHYLDCSAASSGDSLHPDAPWNSLAQANDAELHPGDSLLLRRGSTCSGQLAPRGSGSAAAPITLGAYGTGPLPIVRAESSNASLSLFNQQHWTVEDLELSGGSPYGVHISGTAPALSGFLLRNLIVHDVTGAPLTKESGLIVIGPAPQSPAVFDDILIDGVTVYNTSQWAGIIVTGASFHYEQHTYGEHVTVRNSVIHDVAGDGLLLASIRHALIERNVAWNTGMQETETIGTPNALWQWMCVDCRVAWNEGFFSDSPGVDGGVFDIDFGDIDNIVEHNFAHDSQGYCVSVFGAEGHGGDSIHSIVRRNTCLHNARSPRLARRQGALYVNTWHGGRLNGLLVEDNTFLWQPPLDAPALHIDATFFGELPNRVSGNTVFLEAGTPFLASPEVHLADNRVLAAADPAFCTQWRALQPESPSAISARGWRLVALLASSDAPDLARGLAVSLASLGYQYRDRDLRTALWLRDASTPQSLDRIRSDWHLNPSLALAPSAVSSSAPELFLLTPSGVVAARWPVPVDPAQLWLSVAAHLGAPTGMQSLPACPRQ